MVKNKEGSIMAVISTWMLMIAMGLVIVLGFDIAREEEEETK